MINRVLEWLVSSDEFLHNASEKRSEEAQSARSLLARIEGMFRGSGGGCKRDENPTDY